MKRTLSVLLAMLLCLLAGCSFDVTTLLDREPVRRVPGLSRAEKALSAQPQSSAAVLRVVMDGQVVGDVPDAVAADKLYRAVTDGLHVYQDETDAAFSRKLLVLDASGKELMALNLADGGEDLAEKDGVIYVIPAYTFAILEGALWSVDRSLGQRQFVQRAEDKQLLTLQTRLETEMRVLLAQRYGPADAYLFQWEVMDSDCGRDNITLCLMLRFALYRFEGDSLFCAERETAAVKLTYDWQEGNLWQLGAAKMSDPDAADVKASVRSVFDFDLTQAYMKAAKTADSLDWDIESQAREFLRRRGLGRYTVG